jgi:hypothetical protein
VRCQSALIQIHLRAYSHQQKLWFEGFHASGPLSPFAPFAPASMLKSASGSLAYASRSTVLYAAELAPDHQAFARGTAWSMSTSEESVKVCPVYGSTYVPAVME